MDLDTVSYVFQSLEGTFTIKPRLSRRWRVKHDSMPWGDSFATAEEAAKALAERFAVPANLQEWTEIGDFHTDVGGFAPPASSPAHRPLVTPPRHRLARAAPLKAPSPACGRGSGVRVGPHRAPPDGMAPGPRRQSLHGGPGERPERRQDHQPLHLAEAR
jgi:hypothetical protein